MRTLTLDGLRKDLSLSPDAAPGEVTDHLSRIAGRAGGGPGRLKQTLVRTLHRPSRKFSPGLAIGLSADDQHGHHGVS